MGWYREHVLPRVDAHTLDRPEIDRLRARVCARLAGVVVEVGFGSGLNVAHYPPAVDRVRAVEPSRLARRLAAPRVAGSRCPVEVTAADAARLPYPDGSADSGLLTWTLCALPDPLAGARELHRVLRPGGRLYYLEHGAHPDPRVARRQRRLNRLNHACGGCWLDRRAPDVLAAAGFHLDESREFPLPGTPGWTGYVYEGVARAAG